MHWSMTLLLLTAVPADQVQPFPHFNNYKDGYNAARDRQAPLLVILNPSTESEKDLIQLDAIQKTQVRRELLKSYVVVTIDTSSKRGQTVHKQFGSKPLPRVIVIDRNQEWQIYRTSEPVYGQLWTEILETFKTGDPTASLKPEEDCPT